MHRNRSWKVARLALGLIAGASACNEAPQHEPTGSGGANVPEAAASGPTGAPSAGTDHSGHGAPLGSQPPPGASSNAATLPSGYAKISIDPARAAGMGLLTARVEQRHFQRAIRAAGIVGLDETRTSHVHSKVRGWIEHITANFVGKAVKAGSPLCTIFSQDVYAAQLEFLSVLESTGGRSDATGAFAAGERDATQKLLAAARRRLTLWDVPAGQIARLEKTRQPQRTFTLVAPRSGIIVSKQAIAGMFIDPGTELYVISDVSRLWLVADVYAADVPWMQVGAAASLRIEGLESEPQAATIGFLPPTIEESTRTLKVRFELDNKQGLIRPGAFATAEIGVDLGTSLAIPESSVIHAGDRAIVFVVKGRDVEPRAVDLGPVADGYYRVLRGVAADESVAVGAQFLIDSESRLRATSGPGVGHGGH